MTVSLILLSAAALVIVDQLLKIWVLGTLVGAPSVTLIPGLLQLTYVENRGAAFGIFQGKTQLLSIVTGIVLAGIIVALVMGKFKHKLVLWSMGLIIAGGVGNLIDRVLRGFVVDYIYFVPINFPVFNLADCCVVSGTFLLVVYLLLIEPRQERRKKQLDR